MSEIRCPICRFDVEIREDPRHVFVPDAYSLQQHIFDEHINEEERKSMRIHTIINTLVAYVRENYSDKEYIEELKTNKESS